MKSKIVQLSGSPAITVPQPLLDACHLQNEVEIEAQGGCLVIRNPQPARAGWEEAFRQMAASGDDKMIDVREVSGGMEWHQGHFELTDGFEMSGRSSMAGK